ncbi:sulfite exporter TauE/SafE family protein [Jiella mangrovi]|uniref:sulfite exporter TauE/SafE family protein n=1 Tax=Jiella mangrovi TaxID=2821407 RepID=UPI001FD74400|nr:sulfite exporter TauE/SafE family protein [Jiella mangrovi]
MIAAFALIAGLARGFSGFGAALIFVPLASSLIGPKLAAPLLLIVDGIAASGLIPNALGRADIRGVAVMAIGAIVGIPLGTALLALVSPLTVRWFIAAMVTGLLVLLLSGWRYSGRRPPLLTVAVGWMSGMFTGAAGAGGPPVVAYWLGTGSDGAKVRANIVMFFAFGTLVTTVSYTVGGLFQWSLVPLAWAATPLYGLGLFTGSRLFGKASDRTYRWICYGLIAGATIISLPVLDPLLRS